MIVNLFFFGLVVVSINGFDLLIGQIYEQEFKNYVSAVSVPDGSSHYADMYKGAINQGDGMAFVEYMAATYPGTYAEVGISWKDDRAASGYPTSWCNLVYLVCQDIANGKYDSQIDELAQTMKKYNLKWLARLDYEVSRFLFSYRLETGCNSGQPINFSDPTIIDNSAYRNAFNYMANRIRNVNGASNVEFIFHPVRGPDDAKDLYPGAQYVSRIGVSVFNNDVCLPAGSTQNCNGQRLDPNLKQVLSWGGSQKPLQICESAVQEPASQSSSGFIDYLGRIKDILSDYPVEAFVYINSNWPAHGWESPPWGDSRVQINSQVKSYWESMIQIFKNQTTN